MPVGQLQYENLILPIPNDFQLGIQGQQGPTTMISEYIPRGETVNSWSRMITVQLFRHLKKIDPEAYVANFIDHLIKKVPGSEGGKAAGGTENGYPFSIGMFTCSLNPGTGKAENFWMKVISGNDCVYSVQYARRSVMSEEIVAPTMLFLKSVYVCDTRLPDSPCPSFEP